MSTWWILIRECKAMPPVCPSRAPHLHRAFMLLEILLILVVIAILIGGVGYFARRNEREQSTYQLAMDRAEMTACQASRAAVEADIMIWMQTHPGQEPTEEKLREAGINIQRCPAGGTYIIYHGDVYCTKHYPPPAPAQFTGGGHPRSPAPPTPPSRPGIPQIPIPPSVP